MPRQQARSPDLASIKPMPADPRKTRPHAGTWHYEIKFK